MNFLLSDILASDWPPDESTGHFDWVVGIFIQFVNGAERERQFAVMKQLARPGGRILLQGYTPKQLEFRTPEFDSLSSKKAIFEKLST